DPAQYRADQRIGELFSDSRGGNWPNESGALCRGCDGDRYAECGALRPAPKSAASCRSSRSRGSLRRSLLREERDEHDQARRVQTKFHSHPQRRHLNSFKRARMKLKNEIRMSKFETNSKQSRDQNSKRPGANSGFGNSGFEPSNLFQISYFGFRASD